MAVLADRVIVVAVDPNPVCDFESLTRWENFTAPIAGELDNYCPVLGRHIKRLKTQGVVYLELMIPGAGLFCDEVEAVEKVGAFRDWVTRQEDGEIQVEFIALSGRNKSPEQMRAHEGRILALHKAGLIVGIALAGSERGYPVKLFHSTGAFAGGGAAFIKRNLPQKWQF